MLRSSYGQPVAQFTAVPHPAACNQGVNFDGSSSYHETPGRSIIAWEWDFDYDGMTFDLDAAGVQQTHPFGQFGSYTVALRVTDDDSPPVQDIATTVIDVSLGNQPPMADADGPYTIEEGQDLPLDGSNSADPDEACGDYIVLHEWDLDMLC
jgi:PKD repeat protein